MGEINKSERVLACGPILGELGWNLFAFSGIARFLKKSSPYQNHTCLVMANKGHYPIYQFADQFVPIPSWFDNYNFISASYDMPNMPAEVYGNLIKYFRRFYYEECKEVFEFRTPRTHTFTLVQTHKQYFEKLTPTADGIFLRDALLKNFPDDKEILVVMPRYRVMPEEAQFGENKFNDMRNWPPLFWQDLIMKLLNDGYLLVIAGTQNGIPPINYNLPNVINLANLDSTYIMDTTLAFMEVALGTIGSQSGGTHLALQAGSPTWVLGHEVQRHAVDCNPLKTPCVYCDSGLPYANIFPDVAYGSIQQFITHVKENIKGGGKEVGENNNKVENLNNIDERIEEIVDTHVDHIAEFCSISKDDAVNKIEEGEEPVYDLWRREILESKTEVINFYERLDNYIFGLAAFTNERRMSYLKFIHDEYVKDKDRFLDFGAGIGDLGLYYSNRLSVVSLDVGGATQEFAKFRAAKFGANMEFYNTIEGMFDVITAQDVLEHIPDPYEDVQKISNHLNPLGVLITSGFWFNPNVPLHLMGNAKYRDTFVNDFRVMFGLWLERIYQSQKDKGSFAIGVFRKIDTQKQLMPVELSTSSSDVISDIIDIGYKDSNGNIFNVMEVGNV